MHAGFYYTADSLKAKFTCDGNTMWHEFCQEKGLKINECKKVVVAQNEGELAGLEELKKRADANGVKLEWLEEEELEKFSSSAKTHKKALLSPTTATVDPKKICKALALHVKELGVEIYFDTQYLGLAAEDIIRTSRGLFRFSKFINSTGLYADKIAKDFSLVANYTIIPFKGIYLKDRQNLGSLDTNIYPVPNLKNPFLGVHYTYSVKKEGKIGPTAIPAFWRENYAGFKNFNLKEFLSVLYWETLLFIRDDFGFRSLAVGEIRKYNKEYFLNLAKKLTKNISHEGFTAWSKPGIRAQLLNTKTLELVQDFVIEEGKNSLHVLNAVSPAFTCALPFAHWIVDEYIEKK